MDLSKSMPTYGAGSAAPLWGGGSAADPAPKMASTMKGGSPAGGSRFRQAANGSPRSKMSSTSAAGSGTPSKRGSASPGKSLGASPARKAAASPAKAGAAGNRTRTASPARRPQGRSMQSLAPTVGAVGGGRFFG
jgi:hypothetical protein